MDIAYFLLLALAPLVGAALGVVLGRLAVLREIRDLQYGLAQCEARLISEVKRRAADTRWRQDEPADVEAQVKELRDLVTGQEDERGFVKGKEGGIYRGPR